MDISSPIWSTEMGFDEYLLSGHDMETFGELLGQETRTEFEDNLKKAPSCESFNNCNSSVIFNSSSPEDETSHAVHGRPSKQLKTNCWNLVPANSPHLLSFGNSKTPPTRHVEDPSDVLNKTQQNVSQGNMNVVPQNSKGSNDCQNYGPKDKEREAPRMNRKSLQSQDHVIAERKRRQKLSQNFIALSAVVPCLKKMDKATILADAIKYIRQLQESVKNLEEQNKKRTLESVALVQKSQLSTDDNDFSSSDDYTESNSKSNQVLPEIEAKVSDNYVLLRVHCELQKGLLVKILSEVEKLNLTVVNSSVLPFGNSHLDITIIAQMGANFCIKDLVKNLRAALSKFM